MSSPAPVDPKLARREAAVQFLYGRIDYERHPPTGYKKRHFKLDRMRALLDRLGNPHHGLAVVHVAGTKGKGSTAAMVGAMLTLAGHRTGVFSSPHLDRLEERIAVDGRPCSTDELVELVDRIEPVVRAMDVEAGTDGGPTYFEITTALALLHFARQDLAAAVLEVGLGGRLDSTNVCRPMVSVITSISLDHTRQLGNTLESIAAEKAGIVKPGVPVVSGVVPAEPREVIRRICDREGCRLIELGVDFDFDYHPPRGLEATDSQGKMAFRCRGGDLGTVPIFVAGGHKNGTVPLRTPVDTKNGTRPDLGLALEDLSLKPLGRHQAANAAVALAVVAELRRQGWDIPQRAIRAGLAEANCPARVQLVARRPAVIIDAAHNVASVRALVEVLRESFSVRRRLLVFATTQEKDVRGMLAPLAAEFDPVIFTRYLSNPRAVPPEDLQGVASELGGPEVVVAADPARAWSEVLGRAQPDDLVCVTGSFFLAAEMWAQCRARPFGSRVHAAGHFSGTPDGP